MSDDRSIAYRENDTSIYRASGAGSCITALVAAMLGYKEDRSTFTHDILMNAAKEGNLHEGAIVEELKRDYGWRVYGGQDVVEVKVIPRVFVRGHIDGLCIPKGMRNERLLEIKTMSRDRFKKWKALGDNVRERLLSDDFYKYGWQISAYMYAHDGMPAMYVVKNRDSGELMIEEIKLPPVSWKQIRTKIIQAEMWRKRGELPDCEGSSGEKFFCPYPYLHNDVTFGDEPEDEDAPVDDVTLTLIAGMAERYADLAGQVKLLKPLDSERKDVGVRLIEAMGGKDGTKKVVAGGYSVTRSGGATVDRKATNAAVAEALGIELEAYEQTIADNEKKRTYVYPRVTKLADK